MKLKEMLMRMTLILIYKTPFHDSQWIAYTVIILLLYNFTQIKTHIFVRTIISLSKPAMTTLFYAHYAVAEIIL